MERVLEAIYTNGVLKPLESLDLPEDQRVVITIHVPEPEEPDEALQAWGQVFAGLSEQDIAEIERIALDRSHFMDQRDEM
ncbi:MAG: antitoxin family protein [Ardenticatenaceae bacterium]|nr:antitoxin family protein [Ardenticatenaceae bacterium]